MVPIRAGVTVDCEIDHAFRVFTDEMASRWPLERYSMAADPGFGPSAESVVVEGWEGGRVYELRSDGAQGQWATVLAWEPPRWLLLAWKPNTEDRPPTEVEVTFEELGGLTRVEWVHRGWERLGLLAEEARAGYGAGWQQQLRRYASAVEAAHRPHAN